MKGNLEHPYSVDGKYYAKIDGELHEISEEVFREMHNSYRRSLEKKVETKNEKGEVIERKPREVSFTEQYGENAQSVMDAIPDSSVDVENEVVERMEHQEVHKIISKLEPEEKLIIYSVFFEGKTQDEVGRIMGISQPAVHQRLEKILEKMHQMLL